LHILTATANLKSIYVKYQISLRNCFHPLCYQKSVCFLLGSDLGPNLLTACDSTNPLLVVKHYSQDLLKTRCEKLALKRCGRGYFCSWPFYICICRCFPFRHNIYGRRVFNWNMFFLLVFAPLFTTEKKHNQMLIWNIMFYICILV